MTIAQIKNEIARSTENLAKVYPGSMQADYWAKNIAKYTALLAKAVA